MAIGNPISLTNNIAEKTSSQIAAAGQGQFIVPGGYLINKLGVYRNGVKLSQSSDYTANDGDTVNLIVPANDGDVIQFQVFDYFNIADAITTEGGTVAGTLTVEGSIVANGGVTGDLTGDVTGDISGATATFTGDVSIGGTLTYEDVTNIDSVGIITARSGIHVTGGSVGIGTDDPQQLLELSSGAPRLRITDNNTTAATSNSYLEFQGSDARSAVIYTDSGGLNLQTDAPATNPIRFLTGGTGNERMRIDSDGNVGIGSTSPEASLNIDSDNGPTDQALLVRDHNSIPINTDFTAQISSYGQDSSGLNGSKGGLFVHAGFNRNIDIARFSSIDTGFVDVPRMVIKDSGDVGIGTTSPDQKLDVIGNIVAQASDSSSGAQIESGGALEIWRSDGVAFIDFKSSSAEDFDCRIQQASDGLSFATGGNGSSTEQMRIDSSGDVGIGTTQPTEKLHVIGNILASGNITAFSDIKLKDNIEVIPNALDKVVQIRGVTFDRIDEEVPRQSGVIAQEVEKVLPEVVITNKDGIKSVAYGNLVGLLIESIKELKVEINELKERLEE